MFVHLVRGIAAAMPRPPPCAGEPEHRREAMAKVELTRHLYTFFPHLEGQALDVEAATVAEVVAALERIAPGFAFYVCDERGRLRTHVNIFVGNDRVADRTRLSDRVAADSRVFIAQALSGG